MNVLLYFVIQFIQESLNENLCRQISNTVNGECLDASLKFFSKLFILCNC